MKHLLGEFHDCLVAALSRPTGLDARGDGVAKALALKLQRQTRIEPGRRTDNPLGEVLEQAMARMDSLPPHASALADALAAIASHLAWYRRAAPGNLAFEMGHVNAQIIGPNGLEVREDVVVGATLMRPGIRYPDHSHPPQEVYAVLSDGLWRQDNGPWWNPGPGGYVYNPAAVVHAMQSTDVPLLAVWCLDTSTTPTGLK